MIDVIKKNAYTANVILSQILIIKMKKALYIVANMH